VVKSHHKNKNKKLAVKGKGIAKNFNDNYFIYNKTRHLDKDCRNKGGQGNPMKRIFQTNVTEVDYLTNEVSEMNLSCVVSEVSFINNLE
jgi:hypothetical protein